LFNDVGTAEDLEQLEKDGSALMSLLQLQFD
jgi:hypothetical protein